MLKLKRIALTVFTVICSNIILTNEIHAASDCCSRWSVGIAALYLQPSFGGNGLGYSSYGNYDGNDDQGRFVGVSGALNHINNINPKYAWGFQLGGVWHYDPVNDVDIEWYHLNENINGHFPTGTVFSGSNDGFYAGHLKLREDWNAVNLEAGHSLSFDGNKAIRIHGGLGFANIKNKFTNYPQLTLMSSPLFVTTETLSYTGFGPRMGKQTTFQ